MSWGGRKAAVALQSSERQARLSAQRGRVQLPTWTLGGGVAPRTATSPVDREPSGGVAGENERILVQGIKNKIKTIGKRVNTLYLS